MNLSVLVYARHDKLKVNICESKENVLTDVAGSGSVFNAIGLISCKCSILQGLNHPLRPTDSVAKDT